MIKNHFGVDKIMFSGDGREGSASQPASKWASQPARQPASQPSSPAGRLPASQPDSQNLIFSTIFHYCTTAKDN